MTHASIEFFDRQFRRHEPGVVPQLNPFEVATLPFLHGRVLDFGCGMGGLALAAAERGCVVTAFDASPAGIGYLEQAAAARSLPITAAIADLRDYRLSGDFDCVVSIGLLMFFDCATAFKQLDQLKSCLVSGGIAAINVLVEGTSYFEMFDPSAYCLFSAGELERRFAGWQTLHFAAQEFAAPNDTLKCFETLIVRKP